MKIILTTEEFNALYTTFNKFMDADEILTSGKYNKVEKNDEVYIDTTDPEIVIEAIKLLDNLEKFIMPTKVSNLLDIAKDYLLMDESVKKFKSALDNFKVKWSL